MQLMASIIFSYISTAGKTYKSTNSILIGLLTISLIVILFFLNGTVWKSKLIKFNKIILTLVLTCAIGATYILVIHRISSYFIQKDVESILDFEKIKQDYKAQSELNIKQELLDIIEDLKASFVNEKTKIYSYMNIIQKINIIINNPFFDDQEAEHNLIQIRNEIVQTLKEYGKNNPEFLINFEKAEQLNSMLRRLERNPVKIEYSRILIEEGPSAFFKFFEELYQTEEGINKLKKTIQLQRDIAMQYLDSFVDDPVLFKELVTHILINIITITNQYKREIQFYLDKTLPKIIKTIQGRKHIIQDIRKFYKVAILYVNSIYELSKIKNLTGLSSSDFSQVIEEKLDPQIEKILQEIKRYYLLMSGT